LLIEEKKIGHLNCRLQTGFLRKHTDKHKARV